MKNKYKTEQEIFWIEEFGDEYIKRNSSQDLFASNLKFFSKALKSVNELKSCFEIGANIGLNLKAIKMLYPNIKLEGIEINKKAHEELVNNIGEGAYHGSILNYDKVISSELILIKTVLIHINPDLLKIVYKFLYESSSRYILISEYYNPTPVEIIYRGFERKLFKRDFAGELLSLYPQLKIIDYGFEYHKIPPYMNDDTTWFLLEK
jgi:pseudaminic acid biosynthesis-associated methylase